jgi:hypothetical protein
VSYSWTTNHDGDPTGVHTLACPVWSSPDPTDVCTCGADQAATEAQKRLSTADRLDLIHATRKEAS